MYLALSSPLVARALEGALDLDLQSAEDSAAEPAAVAIVVLGGGTVSYRTASGTISELSDSTSLRLLEGVRLYRLLDEPLMIISGGSPAGDEATPPETEPMVQELLAAGIPAERIRTDPISGSTREQAVNLAARLRELRAEPFLLVTSPIHMRRALASFRAEQLAPVPAPSAQHALGDPVLSGGVLPHPAALNASQAALRETLALGYYWLRGWLRSP